MSPRPRSITAAAALTLTAVFCSLAAASPAYGAERAVAAPAPAALPSVQPRAAFAQERSAPPRAGALLSAASPARVWVGHRRNRAMRWARTQAGKPYVYGGAGPSSYDCSGLVMAAYAHAAGIRLPHSTYAMLASGMLVRVIHPKYGYLAFFGSGHVELYVRPGVTFGAHHTGLPVSFRAYNGWWHPTAYYRLR